MSESELFKTYEQSYLELSDEAKRTIASASKMTGEKKKAALRKVGKNIDKAQEKIRNMEMEANSIVSRDIQYDLKNRLKNFKKDIASLKSDLKRVTAEKEKQELFSGASDDGGVMTTSDDYRQKLIQNTQRLDRSSESIKKSLTTIHETQAMAVETATTLKSQGDTMRATRDKVIDINQEVNQGSRKITRMGRRQITNKIILVVVILVLLLIIAVILFFVLYPIISKIIDMFKQK